MGKKYDNPLKENFIMKDFIYMMSKQSAFDTKIVLLNCLTKVSNIRKSTIQQLKKKFALKLIYFFGTFLFVFGILDSLREYLR